MQIICGIVGVTNSQFTATVFPGEVVRLLSSCSSLKEFCDRSFHVVKRRCAKEGFNVYPVSFHGFETMWEQRSTLDEQDYMVDEQLEEAA